MTASASPAPNVPGRDTQDRQRWLAVLSAILLAAALMLAPWPGRAARGDFWLAWGACLLLYLGLNLCSYRADGSLIVRIHSLPVVSAFLALGMVPALAVSLIGTPLAEGLRLLRTRSPNGIAAAWRAGVDAAILSVALLVSGAAYHLLGGNVLGAAVEARHVPTLAVLFGLYSAVRVSARLFPNASDPLPRTSRVSVRAILTGELILPLLALALALACNAPDDAWLIGVTGTYLIGGLLFRVILTTNEAQERRTREAEQLAEDLAHINATSSAINASLDLHTVLQSVCQAALKVTGGQQAAVLLQADEGRRFTLAENGHLRPALVEAIHRLLHAWPDPAHWQTGSRAIFVGAPPTDPAAPPMLRAFVEHEAVGGLLCRALPALDGLREEHTPPLTPPAERAPLGFLIVFYETSVRPGEQQSRLFDILADQATTALEHARLYQESQSAIRRLTYLADSTRAFSSSITLDLLGELVVDWLVNVLNTDSAVLALWDPEAQDLVIQARARRGSSGLVPRPPTGPLRLSDMPEAVWVLRNRWRRMIQANDRDISPAMRAWMAASGLQALSLAPLVARGEAIGLLALGLTQDRAIPFSDAILIDAIATQAAAALYNARLHSYTEEILADRLLELTALENILQRLSNSLDLDTIVDHILEAAYAVTGAEMVACALYAPGGGTLNLAARLDDTAGVQWRTIHPDSTGIVGRVLRTQRPALVMETRNEPDYLPPPGMDRAFASELCVPVIYEGQTLGAINLESTQPRAFDEFHLNFVEGLAGHAASVIERARLYEAVRSGRDRTQAILNTVRDGLMLVDHAGMIVQANPATERLFGLDFGRYTGRHVLRLVAALERRLGGQAAPFGRLRATVRRLADSPERSVVKEEIRLDMAGQPRWIEITSAPVLSDTDDVFGRLLVFHDVTDERLIEQTRAELNNMILHDLRSPLNSIMGSIDMVRDLSRDPGDAPVLAEVLQIAQSGVENLLSLVESMLDVARLEDRRMPLRVERQSVAGPLHEALRSLDVLASGAQVTLTASLPPDLPDARIDGDKIRRVIVNLVDNALRFTPSGGRVLVQAECLPGSEMLRIGVIDNGPGVAPEARERIFEKFMSDVSAAAGLRRRGIGLGLTFCRLAVEAHGGQIWVEEARPPDRGAAFYFTLPLAAEKSMMQADAADG